MEPGRRSVDSVLLAAMTTAQPCPASPRAMARPIPRLAPVMIATLSLSMGNLAAGVVIPSSRGPVRHLGSGRRTVASQGWYTLYGGARLRMSEANPDLG